MNNKRSLKTVSLKLVIWSALTHLLVNKKRRMLMHSDSKFIFHVYFCLFFKSYVYTILYILVDQNSHFVIMLNHMLLKPYK